MHIRTVLAITAFLLVIASCSSPTQDPNFTATLVVQTMDALDATQNINTDFSVKPTLPPALPTPEPTKESITDKITGAFEFGYCPEGKARKAIAEIREIVAKESDEADPTKEPVDVSNWGLLKTEEERQKMLAASERIIESMKAIDTPDCLEDAKLMYIKAMSDMHTVVKNYSIENNDGSWFGDLFKVSLITEMANSEIEKVEACLPDCKKP